MAQLKNVVKGWEDTNLNFQVNGIDSINFKKGENEDGIFFRVLTKTSKYDLSPFDSKLYDVKDDGCETLQEIANLVSNELDNQIKIQYKVIQNNSQNAKNIDPDLLRTIANYKNIEPIYAKPIGEGSNQIVLYYELSGNE